MPHGVVADGVRRRESRREEAYADVVADRGRGALLDHLLVAALDAALALPDRDPVAQAVGRDLDLDVPGMLQELFRVDGAVAEGGLGLRGGAGERAGHVFPALDPPHSLASPARRGLEKDGIPRLFAELRELRGISRGAGRAGHDRDARLLHEHAAARLRPHGFDRRGRGADEGEPRLGAGAGERRALREEAVARVHERGAGLSRGGEERGDREVALRGGRRSEPDREVRGRDVGRGAVDVRVDRDGLDPEVATRAKDPQRDFAAVRDEKPHSATVIPRSTLACHSEAEARIRVSSLRSLRVDSCA